MAYGAYPQIYPQMQNWYGQFYQPVQPPMMQNQQMQMAQMQNQQAQQAQQQSQPQGSIQGGFVRVQSEQEARAYPVAPGNSITFIDESRPYCYTKSVDMSQLDRPKFDKYRLVKEEDAQPVESGVSDPPEAAQTISAQVASNLSEYALKSDLGPLWAEVEALKRRLDSRKKRTVSDDGESTD